MPVSGSGERNASEAGAGRPGVRDGLKASVPIVIGYLPTAATFGLAAREVGLGTAEAVGVSALVYAGASQFALVGLSAAGSSAPAAAAAVLLMNLRHALYGPVLAPRLRGLGSGRAAAFAFGLTDQVFALVAQGAREDRPSFRWLMGLAAGCYLSWLFGTWAGAVGGGALLSAVPSLAPAMGFALPALFVALLISMVREPDGGPLGRDVLVTLVVAGAVAAGLHLAELTSWAVPGAVVAGTAAGALLAGGKRR